MRIHKIYSVWIGGIVAAVILVGTDATLAEAQNSGLTLGLGLDAIYNYPKQLRSDCDDGFGFGGTARVSYGAGELLSGELGISMPFEIKRGRGKSAAGGRCPGGYPGTTEKQFPRESRATVAEGRIVISPRLLGAPTGILRLIAGGGWYLGPRAPTGIVGIGLAHRSAFGFVTVDIEHWRVGIPYEAVYWPLAVPATTPEILESGREWTGITQVRAAIHMNLRRPPK